MGENEPSGWPGVLHREGRTLCRLPGDPSELAPGREPKGRVLFSTIQQWQVAELVVCYFSNIVSRQGFLEKVQSMHSMGFLPLELGRAGG